MNYAVIKTGGKQYRVAPGDILEVDRLENNTGDQVTFENVLLNVVGDEVTFGAPLLTNVVVKANVLENTKGDKIRVTKFKAKARYRRVTGFRASLTKVQITQVGNLKHEEKKEVTKVNKEVEVKEEQSKKEVKEPKKAAPKKTVKKA